jgi:hypothetical protein
MAPTSASLDITRFCDHCGTQAQPQAKFCLKCGATIAKDAQHPSVPKLASVSAATSSGDEISALEQMVADHPADETYQKLLAIQLHDDAMKDWWRDPKDGQLLCTTVQQIQYARKQIDRAVGLKFDDPKLRADLERMRQLVESMEKRQYTGTWFHIIVLGLFYIAPGVLWWYVNRRPTFLINRDYIRYAETGRHSGALVKMGGAMERVSDFFDQIFGSWSFIPTLVIMVMLCPLFMILAYKQNYFDMKKEYEV